MTETPIGTIVYAIDDESIDTDPFINNKNKNFQLQDVVTHGNFNDKSFLNHNLFTIGDGNDANTEIESDEDDDDIIDIDGVVDRQATSHSKFANFAFNSDKPIRNSTNAYVHGRNGDDLQKNHLIRQNKSDENIKQHNNENHHELRQGHEIYTAENTLTTRLPSRQMTYKHSSKLKHFLSTY